jgi:Retroviral aspartyl protease.
MPEVEFPYIEQESKIFGKILRPLISLEFFSNLRHDWIPVDEVLADTGADVTILPRFIGEILVDDITTGQYIEIKGVVPSSTLVAFIHQMKIRIGDKEFELPVAIADSNAVPSIFGRLHGLDRFDVSFSQGKNLKLLWQKSPV